MISRTSSNRKETKLSQLKAMSMRIRDQWFLLIKSNQLKANSQVIQLQIWQALTSCQLQTVIQMTMILEIKQIKMKAIKQTKTMSILKMKIKRDKMKLQVPPKTTHQDLQSESRMPRT